MNKVVESNSGCTGAEVSLKKDFWGNFTEIKISGIGSRSFDLNLCKVDFLDEDSSKRFVGSAAAGIGGALLLGPVGLFAGLLAGGNRKTGLFIIRQGDDAHAIQITNKKWIGILRAKAMLSHL